MSTLTRRGARANAAARLPGIQAERVTDPAVREALGALREWVEVRLGARGDKFERAVTFRDLEDPIKRIEALESAEGDAGTGGSSSSDLTALTNRVTALERAATDLTQELRERVGTLERLVQAMQVALGDLDLLTLDQVRAALNVFRANQSVRPIGLRVTENPLVLDAALTNNYSLEIVQDVRVDPPTHLTDGMEFNLIFQMDEVGGHLVTFDATYDFGYLPVVLPNSPNDIIRVEGYYDAESGRILCEMHVGYNLIRRAIGFAAGASITVIASPAVVGSSAGSSSVLGVGQSLGTLVRTGAGTLAGRTQPDVKGRGRYLEARYTTGSASGLGAMTAPARALLVTDGTAAGAATVTSEGVGTSMAVGSAAGASSVSAANGSTSAADGSAAGSSAVAGVGFGSSLVAGSAAGSATTSAVGESTAAAAGASTGSSTVSAASTVVGPTCPDYSTVTLAFTSETYTAPTGDDADLEFLPCPYTAPTVE